MKSIKTAFIVLFLLAGNLVLSAAIPAAELQALMDSRKPVSRYEGYLIVGDELRPLPIGSTLDAIMGIFSWQPGPGFLGDYQLAFADRENKNRLGLTVRIEPRYSKNGE
jgi:hypothetical protein